MRWWGLPSTHSNGSNIESDFTNIETEIVNDIKAMKLCKYSCCPFDSHPFVKKQSKIILKTIGGEGVMREIAEKILNINLAKFL